MAGMRVVGRVAVKVWPDVSEFRKRAKVALEKASKGLKVEVPLEVDDDQAKLELRRATLMLNRTARSNPIKIPVKLDTDGTLATLRTTLATLRRVAKLNPVRVSVGTDSKGLKGVADLRSQVEGLKDSKVNVGLNLDDSALKGLENRLSRKPIRISGEIDHVATADAIADVRRQFATALREVHTLVKVTGDDGSLRRLRDALTRKLSDIRVRVHLDADRDLPPVSVIGKLGWSPSEITKAKRELREAFRNWKTEVGLDWARRDIETLRENINEGLRNLRAKVRVDYDNTDLGRLEKRLKEAFETKIKPSLDNSATRLVKLQLQRIFHETASSIRVALSKESIARAKAVLAAAFRNITVKVKVVLDNKSVRAVGTALAALTGSRLVKEIWRIDLLKNFDKMLPMLSLISTAVGALAAGVLALSGDVLTLGRHLAQIVPIGLAVPGVFTGIVVAAVGLARALRDFNTELPQVSKGFAEIGKSVSKKFWAEAKGPLNDLANKALPKIRQGMDLVATSQGKWFAAFGKGMSNSVLPALDSWFKALAGFTDNLHGMAAPLASIIRSFGDLGAHYLPQLGSWLTKITTQFSTFLGKAVESGQAFKWVDLAVTRLQELWRVVTGVSSIIATLALGAEMAGGASLKGLGDGLHAMAAGLEENLSMVVVVFGAANDAMANLVKSAGPGVVAMFSAIGQSISQVLPLIGTAAGLLVGSLGTILAQPLVGAGLTAFFTGLNQALTILQPALADIGDGLGMLLTLGGTMLSSFAPTLALAFTGAGNAATGLLAALNEIVPALSGGLFNVLSAIIPVFQTLTPQISDFIVLVGTTLGNALSAIAPQIGELASGLGTLFGSLLNAVGPLIEALINGLVPIIQMLAPALGFVAASLAPLVEKIGEMATQLINWLAPIIQQFLADFLPKFQEAWGRLVAALGPVLDGIQQFANFLGPILGPIIQFLLGLLGDTFVGILNGLANTFEGVTKFISGIVDAFSAAMRGDWDGLGEALKKIWDGLWQTILGVVEVILNVGVLSALKKGWTLIEGLFTSGGSVLKGLWDDLWNAVKTLTDDAWNAIKNLVGRGIDGIKGSVGTGLGALKGLADDAWNAFKGACRSGIDGALSLVRDLPGQLKGALGDLGSLLFNSGRSMLDGLARGIRNGISVAVDAARDALSAVRRLFPFSPAKEGPFSGKGWTLYSGRSVAESIGDGIRDRMGYAKRSAELLASVTRDALEASPSVSNANSVTSAYAASPAAGGGDSYEFNLTVPVDDLDQISDLVELAESMRRKARAHGGKK